MKKSDLLRIIEKHGDDTEIKFTLETIGNCVKDESNVLVMHCVTTCQSHNYINLYFHKEQEL